MKILCVGYRDWAIKIYKNLNLNKKKKIYFHCTRSGLNKKISKLSPNIILFYGWSWKIEEKIFSNFNCFMLHPSPLPKFRGGSPIQNQIIRGKKISAVTIFKINKVSNGLPGRFTGSNPLGCWWCQQSDKESDRHLRRQARRP